MKKFTLLALAIMASATSFAQTTLWNGEDKDLNTTAGFWNDGTPELVNNPETDGINTSTKCIKFVANKKGAGATETTIKLPFKELISPDSPIDMNGRKRISFLIKKPDTENVKVELSRDTKDGVDGYWKHRAIWYAGNDTWQKLVFDFSDNNEFNYPEVLAITVSNNTDNDINVYIDNIVIEDAPMVNGKLFSKLTDEDKKGKVTLTGAWMKGSCMNVDDDWKTINYNDYEYFNSLMTDGLTSVDIREAQASDVDADMLIKVNPNALLYANEAYDHVNVVAKQNFTNANNEEVTALYAAKGLELTDANAFSCPEAFTAANVKLTRTVREGINSFVLPFYAGASELGADALATFKEVKDQSVYFTKADHADANVPFITVRLKDAAENKEFTFFGNQKYVEATPASFDDAFKGVYAPQSAEGLYGITDKGELQKGSEKATINSFHAFYEAAEGQTAPAKISFEGEATGINNVAATTVANSAVYDLSGRRVAEKLAGASLVKGIYVVNGKKVVVK